MDLVFNACFLEIADINNVFIDIVILITVSLMNKKRINVEDLTRVVWVLNDLVVFVHLKLQSMPLFYNYIIYTHITWQVLVIASFEFFSFLNGYTLNSFQWAVMRLYNDVVFFRLRYLDHRTNTFLGELVRLLLRSAIGSFSL